MVKLLLDVLCFIMVFEPNLYTDRVYCTASATVLQDRLILSLLGEEEAKNSKAGKTVEEKRSCACKRAVWRDVCTRSLYFQFKKKHN